MMKNIPTTVFALAVWSVWSAGAPVWAQSPPPPSATEQQAIVGDAAAGARKTAMCMGCHGIEGYRNAFPEVHRVPMIAGQNAAFIAAALNAYRSGDRKHPSMRAVAEPLSDQDIADLAAYYSTQSTRGTPASLPETAPLPSSTRVASLLERGDCVSCHGANFSTALDPSYPNIAGQHPDYLYVAMKSYAIDGNSLIGRNNPVMAGIARQFTLDEMRALSRYMGSLPGTLEIVTQPGWRRSSTAE